MRRQHFVHTSIKTVSSREKRQKPKKKLKKQLRKRKWNVYSAIIKSFMFQFGAAFGQSWRRLILVCSAERSSESERDRNGDGDEAGERQRVDNFQNVLN